MEGNIPNHWGLELPIKAKKKKRHYWIHSKTSDSGKTYFWKNL